MREIKFRGKLINSGKWSEGNLIIRKGNNAEIIACTSPDTTPIGTYGRIDVETIGQYTGLKDKNGKEIYEGDIIQDEFYERKAEVVFLEGAFWLDYKEDFGVYNTKHKRYQLLANYDYEQVLGVMGDIYENPELLEV